MPGGIYSPILSRTVELDILNRMIQNGKVVGASGPDKDPNILFGRDAQTTFLLIVSRLRMTRGILLLSVLTLVASSACSLLSGNEAAAVPLAKTLTGAFDTASNKPWTLPEGQSQASRTFAAPHGELWDFHAASTLSVKAERANTSGASVRLRWLVSSRVGGLYLGPSVALPLSGHATPKLNFSVESGELTPVGHQRPWDALAAAEVTSLELRAEYSANLIAPANAASPSIALAGVKLELGSASPAKPEIFDLHLNTPPAGSRAACVISFRINPLPDDPYAATGAGDVRVKLANGQQALAFLDQDFVEINDGAAARLASTGLPVWRAYLPVWPAAGTFDITSGGNAWKIPCAALNAESEKVTSPQTPASRSESTPFENFATPKALARLRWETPLEASAPSMDANWTGTAALWLLSQSAAWVPATAQQVLDLCHMPANTSSTAADLASKKVWRPVPFWNETWGGYAGKRRPDSALAWRMDALLETAARAKDIRPLILFDGSALERHGVFNWASHPLHGTLFGPGEIFRTEEGFDFCARWMRYCLARYAHSPAVSSLLITTDLNAPGAPEFHARIAPLLQDWRAASLADKPVVAFHPLAQPPQVIKEIGSFDANSRNRETNWHVDSRLAKVYGNTIERVGLDGGRCFEVGSRDPSATSLALQTLYAREYSDWRKPADDNFFACNALLFEVWTPPDAPPDLRVGVHLRDRNGNWFQTLLPGMIRPGDWTTYALDLTAANAHGLAAVNHRTSWTDYSRQRIQEIGLHVYSTHPRWTVGGGRVQNLSARFDKIRGVVFPQSAPDPKPEIALFDPASQFKPAPAPPRTYPRGALVEYHVKINKAFANPFDARDCDLVALVKTPSGKTVRVPAFFNQLYERREETPGGDEIVEAIGEEFFTVRYRAQETGPHSLAFELREHGHYDTVRSWAKDDRFTPEGEGQAGISRHWPYTNYPQRHSDGRRPIDKVSFVPGPVTAALDLGAAAFTVAESEKPFHGFVRVAKDRRHFEFDDGSFFYPIGPCLRSPSDTRIPYDSPKFSRDSIDKLGKRGTYQYDVYFDAFGKAGISWARVWMCSWWGALEWRRDWPGYQGLGRYNLANAWRMDYVVDLAEKKNIRLNLAVTNHGQFTLNIDTEWENNPYNAKLGGPLAAPCEIFTRGEAKINHQNKLRYIAARYGHSPAVMAFALFSEIEFTEEYERSLNISHQGRTRLLADLPAPNIESWHAEMATFLKSIDSNRHLVTTHFSHPERGEGTLMVPEIDVATSNAYSAFEELGGGAFDASAALHDFWEGNEDGKVRGFHIFKKPALVEEQGRHWMGMDAGRETNSKTELDADLHAGLWGSMVVPLAGATGYWWWLHIHFDNRYADYSALTKFMAGEDFRPIGDEPPMKTVFRSLGRSPLLGRAMKSDRRMYVWIYNQKTPFGDEEPEEVSNAAMNIGGLRPGKYRVEFWNTYTGEPIGTQDIEFLKDTKNVEVKLPVVKRDIALKIKPVQ